MINYAQVYNSYWSRPDRLGSKSFDDPESIVDQIVSVCGYGKTIDVGCGMGDLVCSLVKRGIDAIGIDVSKVAIHQAELALPGHFSNGSALDIPFKDNSFDILTCTDCLEHISEEDIPRVAKEFYRVVKRYAFLKIATREDRDKKWHLTVRDYTWWENAFFKEGFRTHALIHDVVPYNSVSSISGEATLILEKIDPKVAKVYALSALEKERDLHNDMLRASGPRAHAHIARYDLARRLIRPRDRVLDAACGLGYGSEIIYRGSEASSVLGLDNSSFAIKYASELYGDKGRIEFECKDVLDVSRFDDGSFDLIASFETIEHIDKPEEFLEHCRNALTPGGRFICSVPNLWIDENGEDPNPYHLHVFDFNKIRSLVKRFFIVEKVISQKAGGGLIQLHEGTSLREVPIEGNYEQEDAEWWIVVGMKDPLVKSTCLYRGNFKEEETGNRSNLENVLSFERDYKNPWLLRSMVTLGYRVENQTELVKLAKRALKKYPGSSADHGAALCVLGYQMLDAKIEVESDRQSLVGRIEKYSLSNSENPHVIRWQVSLFYLLGNLYAKVGDVDLAEEAYLRCVNSRWKEFSPHLATKVCDAAFSAGLLMMQKDDLKGSKEVWGIGLKQCFEALRSNRLSIVVNESRPVPFGLREIESVVESGLKCSKALFYLSEMSIRPGPSIWKALSSRSYLEKQRDKLIREIQSMDTERLKIAQRLQIEHESHKEKRILLQETEIQRGDAYKKINELVGEVGKFKSQLELEHEARLKERLLASEAEGERDKLFEKVSVLTDEAEKLKSQLELEHEARLKERLLASEAEGERDKLFEKVSVLTDEAEKLKSQLELEHEARLKERLLASEAEGERDKLFEKVSVLTDEAEKLKSQLELEHEARLKERLLASEAEGERDKLFEKVSVLTDEAEKLKSQLELEHEARLKERLLASEAEGERDKLFEKVSVLTDEAEKLKSQLELEHEARLKERLLASEAEGERDKLFEKVSVLTDEAEKLKSQLELEHEARLKERLLASEAEGERDQLVEKISSLTVEAEKLKAQLGLECAAHGVSRNEIQLLVSHRESLNKTITELEEQRASIEKDRTDRDEHVRKLEQQLELECSARKRDNISYLEREKLRNIEIEEKELRIEAEVSTSKKLSKELGRSRELALESSIELSAIQFRNRLLFEQNRLRKTRKPIFYKFGGYFARIVRRFYCFVSGKAYSRVNEGSLRVAQINTHDLVGGAERSSYDLHVAFRETDGLQSDLFVAGKYGKDDDVHKIEYREADWKYAETWRDKWGLTEILYLTPIEGCFKWPKLRKSEITHIHNMHGHYWNSLSLAIFGFQRPTVLTLHDEYTLTGDCCYTYDCDRWKNTCGKCPRIGMDPDSRYALGGGDLTRLNILIKRVLFRFPRAYPLAIVTPSEWLANRARESKNLRHLPILKIHNGIDLDFWKPGDQALARKDLGLPAGERIGLVVANKLHDPRKGFDIALDAIEALPKNCNLRFVVVGELDENTRKRVQNLSITSTGYVDSKEKMRLLFTAADFTFAMSRVDNLPYMCIESLACGRPILGSNIGGIPEIVADQKAGWLVDRPMPLSRVRDCLMEVERESIDDFEERFRICRRVAESRFSLGLMKNRYLNLYNELIDSVRQGREIDLDKIR